jgi:hypothetical protein
MDRGAEHVDDAVGHSMTKFSTCSFEWCVVVEHTAAVVVVAAASVVNSGCSIAGCLSRLPVDSSLPRIREKSTGLKMTGPQLLHPLRLRLHPVADDPCRQCTIPNSSKGHRR